MELSKHMIGILNLFTLLLSIPVIGAGIWLATRYHSDCVKFLQGPVVMVGVFIFVISLAGLVGAYWRITWLLWLYLLCLLLLIVLLFCFTIFAFAVTNKGAGQALSGRVYKDYRLGDFSSWLQKRVNNPKNWRKIRSCLSDAHVCRSLGEYKMAIDFYRANLSPVQSGCCKPPTSCNYLFLNATYWTRPLNLDADPDCNTYSYVQSQLCFDCNSCRAGILAKLKHDWHKVAVVNIVMLMFLIVTYCVECHTFHRAVQEGRYMQYGKGIF